MSKNDYATIVCNFLNNTQGYIEDYQIRFMLLELFDLDIDETEYEKYITFDLGVKLNEDIEWDDNVHFYEDLHTLYMNIKNNIKNLESSEEDE